MVISNNSNCGAINFSVRNGIETLIINDTLIPNINEQKYILLNGLHKKEIDFIILAGYVKMIPEGVIKKYHQKIINIHPSLLPKFGGKGYYGMKVHEAVIQSGIKETGASVHFVDEHYDHGPVVANKKVQVLKSDTAKSLAEKPASESSFAPDISQVTESHTRTVIGGGGALSGSLMSDSFITSKW